MKASDIVLSLCGHDAGAVLFVMGVEEPYVFLADGKRRRVENPKRKKHKHVRLLSEGEGRAARKIRDGEKVTNNELRRALTEFKEKQQEEGQACQKMT